MYPLPEDLDSKYKFVTLASKRAEQLQMGAATRVEGMDNRKMTVRAQAEVAQGKITLYNPELDEPTQVIEEEEEE